MPVNPRSVANLKRGGSPGRRPGSRNKKTIAWDLLQRSEQWFDTKEYFDDFKQRVKRGRAGGELVYMLRRVKGDPTQHVELAGNEAKPIRVTIKVIRG